MHLRHLIPVGLVLLGQTALAEPRVYTLDPTHSQVVFSYSHAGFSTTYGLVSGFEGTLTLDRDDPSTAQVEVSIAADRVFTGDAGRDDVFLNSGMFFQLDAHPLARFVSTSVTVTSATTAQVTGDMTINGVTRPVTLEARFNGETEAYPFPPHAGKPAVGFDAEARLQRSAFNLGEFAPFVGDEVSLLISIEAVALGQE